MNKISIYGLLNPITNQYFYVGMTSLPLHKRLSVHMDSLDKNEKKVAVIKSIRENNQKPLIILLETIDNTIRCSDRELWWMKKLLNEGHPLVNKSFNKQGRKPVASAKVQICLYVTDETIAKFGSVEDFKIFLYDLIDNYVPCSV